MGKVIKKGGEKKQAFDPSKVRKSVKKAMKDAKLSLKKQKEIEDEIIKPVIDQYKGKRTVKATDLRKSILGRLKRRSKKVANTWRRYEKKKKK